MPPVIKLMLCTLILALALHFGVLLLGALFSSGQRRRHSAHRMFMIALKSKAVCTADKFYVYMKMDKVINSIHHKVDVRVAKDTLDVEELMYKTEQGGQTLSSCNILKNRGALEREGFDLHKAICDLKHKTRVLLSEQMLVDIDNLQPADNETK